MTDGISRLGASFAEVFAGIAARAELAIPTQDGDFEVDGLLYCGKCGTRKQTTVTVFESALTVRCLCDCAAEKQRKEIDAERQRQQLFAVERLRAQGIHDNAILRWTFDADDRREPSISERLRRYCEQWPQMYRESIGVLLWGDIGTGKTFYAACIANYLIDKCVPVLVTSFSKIIHALSGFQVEDKNKYISDLSEYKLLVIDDLGAERQSEFAQEIVFNVVDARYKSGLPIVITTNLLLDDMKSTQNITCSRIYDRILEMCVPIQFTGESRRNAKRKAQIDKAKALLGA